MEFYKLYKDWVNAFGHIATGICITELNMDIECNPQWMSEVVNQTATCVNGDVMVTALVRWVGLSETPFKEIDNND